ncbi:ArsR family transcriptional regulator [Nocardia tengchongensis]|uniref:ArsR family transcriptional regulator n=1 Tax=Nocardia tengchongensis TaxID=2055889 RepID=UPI0036AFDA9B
MPCTHQRQPVGGSQYTPRHANRLRTRLHPRPTPRRPTRRTHGKRRYTAGEIAAEFGVTRPTIYRHLDKPTS